MKTKILADFQTCISLPLTVSFKVGLSPAIHSPEFIFHHRVSHGNEAMLSNMKTSQYSQANTDKK